MPSSGPSQWANPKKLDLPEEIAVLVGEQEQRFTVQKCFLTKSSTFLQKCCNGEWKESKEKEVKLPEVNSTTFATYLQWLYTDELVTGYEIEDAKPDKTSEEKRLQECQFQELATLTIFANFVQDTKLGNKVIDAIMDLHREGRNPLNNTAAIRMINESNPRYSKLYYVFIGLIESVDPNLFALCRDEIPVNMMIDIAIGSVTAISIMERQLSDERPRVLPRKETCRQYHTHDDEEPRCFEEDSEGDDSEDESWDINPGAEVW